MKHPSQEKVEIRWTSWLYPLLALAVFLTLWHLACDWFQLPRFILPKPGDVLSALADNHVRLQSAALRTAFEALAGFGVSTLLGFSIASVLSQAAWLRKSLLPYALIFQTVPIIGVAPLLITWFGNTFLTVVWIATFISVFPIINNTTNGMISIQESWSDLFRLNQARRWQRYLYLQVPASLPQFASGLQIASAASVLGACVGDFFVGSAEQEGLGFLIFQAKDRDASLMFATLAILTIMGLLFYFVTSLASRSLLLHWQERAE